MDFLPNRVYKKCENLEILELEYLRMVDESISETTTTLDKPYELPIEQKSQARASLKLCKKSYCSGPPDIPSDYHMASQCTGTLHCPNHRNFPSCWYVLYSGITTTTHRFYLHYVNTEMFCLPCCQFSSNEKKMPG